MSHSIENKYIGELRTQSTHLKSSDVILTDAPVDNNGKVMHFPQLIWLHLLCVVV